MVQSFRDLQVWQRAMQLSVAIYRLTQGFPREEIYGMSSQMRRSAVSVPSNIAIYAMLEGLKGKHELAH